MELRRTLLIVAMAIVGYFLLINWQREYGATSKVESKQVETSSAANTNDLPVAPPASSTNGDVPVTPQVSVPAEVSKTESSLVSVKTDVLDVQIDLVGGDVVRVALPTYTETVDSKNPFVLLDQSAVRTYVAQTGLIGADGPDANPAGRPHYQASALAYSLGAGQDSLQVVLVLPAQGAIEIRKIFEFSRGDYLVKMRYEISNKGSESWTGMVFGQLKRDSSKDPSASNQGFGMSTFLGAAWWTSEKSYNKVSLDDFSEEPIQLTTNGGWIAMVQHYFVVAWVPDAKSNNTYFTRVKKDTGENFAGFTGPAIIVAPGETKTQSASLYAGPKVQEHLKKISDGLELTVDYGILWFIAQFLFWLLVKIHAVVGNWGWAIVILTVLVKAAFFQLSATSYKSMAHMRRVTPEIQRIREQLANDRAKMSQAMMDLYRKEKINPLGGCLPILVQMPVFIALYWTLMESVELRHAGWILWIRDLSAMDPYFILPLIMGASMFVQMMLNPPPPDPMQARVMKLMPIVFTVMFLWFPAGLVLYWVVNNILSIAQQAVITRQIENAEGKKA
jgi:YidC/Oxa1 family membrane protein insertase